MKKQELYYNLIIFSLLFFSIFAITETLKLKKGDYILFCDATDGFFNEKNPYNMQEINQDMPFRYPPISFFMFKIICNFSSLIIYSFLLIFITIIVGMIDKKFDILYFLAILLTGFNAIYYNLANGQIAIIEALLLTIAILFIYQKNYGLSAVFIGIMAIFKTVPLAFLSLFLVLKKVKLKTRFLLFITGILTFILLHFFSIMFFPKTYKNFIQFMFFSNYPYIDRAGIINPSLYNIVGNFYIYLLIAFIIAIIYLFSKYYFLYNFEYFNLGILMVILALPELKWYSLTISLVSIYFLTRKFNYFKKIICLSIVCIIPIICKLLIVTYNLMFLEYYQYFSLVIFVIFYYFNKN